MNACPHGRKPWECIDCVDVEDERRRLADVQRYDAAHAQFLTDALRNHRAILSAVVRAVGQVRVPRSALDAYNGQKLQQLYDPATDELILVGAEPGDGQ